MMVQWAPLQCQSHCVYLSLTVKQGKDTSWVLVPSCHIRGVASQACPLHLASRAPEVFICCTLKLLFVLVGVCVVLVTSAREVLFIVLILLATWISLEHQAASNRRRVCEQRGTQVPAGCAFSCASPSPRLSLENHMATANNSSRLLASQETSHYLFQKPNLSQIRKEESRTPLFWANSLV